MKILGAVIAIATVYAYFINRELGVNVITPLFNTLLPWMGAMILLVLVWFGNKTKAEELHEKAKDGVTKLTEAATNTEGIPLGWAWLIVVVFVAAGTFYWFGMRPANIKQNCYRQTQYGSGYYESCLRQNGL